MQKRLPKYQYIDHTADVGVKIFGPSLAWLFENAAYALFDIIANPDKVHSATEREIVVEATDLETLLVNW
ncbi:MAG: archease, partial [bacterium]